MVTRRELAAAWRVWADGVTGLRPAGRLLGLGLLAGGGLAAAGALPAAAVTAVDPATTGQLPAAAVTVVDPAAPGASPGAQVTSVSGTAAQASPPTSFGQASMRALSSWRELPTRTGGADARTAVRESPRPDMLSSRSPGDAVPGDAVPGMTDWSPTPTSAAVPMARPPDPRSATGTRVGQVAADGGDLLAVNGSPAGSSRTQTASPPALFGVSEERFTEELRPVAPGLLDTLTPVVAEARIREHYRQAPPNTAGIARNPDTARLDELDHAARFDQVTYRNAADATVADIAELSTATSGPVVVLDLSGNQVPNSLAVARQASRGKLGQAYTVMHFSPAAGPGDTQMATHLWHAANPFWSDAERTLAMTAVPDPGSTAGPGGQGTLPAAPRGLPGNPGNIRAGGSLPAWNSQVLYVGLDVFVARGFEPYGDGRPGGDLPDPKVLVDAARQNDGRVVLLLPDSRTAARTLKAADGTIDLNRKPDGTGSGDRYSAEELRAFLPEGAAGNDALLGYLGELQQAAAVRDVPLVGLRTEFPASLAGNRTSRVATAPTLPAPAPAGTQVTPSTAPPPLSRPAAVPVVPPLVQPPSVAETPDPEPPRFERFHQLRQQTRDR